MTRPRILDSWFQSPQNLKGVGPALYGQLRKLFGCDGELVLPTLADIAFHMPVDVIDRRQEPDMASFSKARVVTLRVKIDEHRAPPMGRRRIPYQIAVTHTLSGESIRLLFFNFKGDYLSKQLPVGEERIISGMLERADDRQLRMVHPQVIVTVDKEHELRRLEPVYPLTTGLHHRKLLQLIEQTMNQLRPLPEWQDAALLAQRSWLPLLESLRHLHAPSEREDISTVSPYYQRCVYDELLASQLALALIRQRMKQPASPFRCQPGALRAELIAQLPFSLTEGQRQVLQDIDADMDSGQRMLRLLQGDVGSGKTVVALLAIVNAIESGGQAALMVPTEILGRQHFAFIEPLLRPLGLNVAVLSGNTDSAQRRQILKGLADGTVHLVIGTHALFQESVVFQNLGVVVIDEQHRFGVNQRLRLSDKGQGTHILLMTATPIPRSLAMTMFGDMDVSALTEKPAGRQPIETRIVPLTREAAILEGIERALAKHEKIYWICPLVEGSEDERSELAAANERYREFQQRFGAENVGLAHGQMKAEERDLAMSDFAEGRTRLLVATTVVEVGVNVPDATIMVIEHAERFGLAQLHQLRGRVGRGDKPSSCLLLYAERISDVAKERLRAMRESNDGFYLAEEDLRLRGGGEILGTKQSGLPQFRFADLARDQALLRTARDEVKLLMHKDPQLQGERGDALRCLLYLYKQDQNIRYLASG